MEFLEGRVWDKVGILGNWSSIGLENTAKRSMV